MLFLPICCCLILALQILGVHELLQANKTEIQAWLFKYIKCLLCFLWPVGRFHIIAFYLEIPYAGKELLEKKVLIWCGLKNKKSGQSRPFLMVMTKSSQMWGVLKSSLKGMLIDTARLCRLPVTAAGQIYGEAKSLAHFQNWMHIGHRCLSVTLLCLMVWCPE